MKILFVITPPYNPDQGGVQRIVEKLGTFFSQHGHSVFLYSTANDGHSDFPFGSLFHADSPGGQINKNNLLKLENIIDDVKPDVILNEMPYEITLRKTLKQARQSNDFLLLGCLNNSLFSVKNNLQKYAEIIFPRFLINLSKNKVVQSILFQIHKHRHAADLRAIIDTHDLFVLPTSSRASLEELEFFIGKYQQSKIRGIPNSIPQFDGKVLPNKEKMLLYVGRLNDGQKRSDLLVDVWQKVCNQLPDWTFEIIGDGPYRNILEARIKKQEIPRITLHGFQQPQNYYQRAKILIMPSAYEGFPSVLLEAQSNKVIPIVFDSYPAVSWIVNDQKDALLIPAFETEKMATSIVELAGDIAKMRTMGDAASINAKRFAIDTVGTNWLRLFDWE